MRIKCKGFYTASFSNSNMYSLISMVPKICRKNVLIVKIRHTVMSEIKWKLMDTIVAHKWVIMTNENV